MNEIPQEVRDMMKRIWRSSEKLHFTLSPRDAWTTVAVLQYAWRNPALNDDQRQMIEELARGIQQGLVELEQDAQKYLEMGWHTEHDVPHDD
jgi:hypothetical protein